MSQSIKSIPGCWIYGLGLGMLRIGLSLRFRAPILVAWSTPGAALLISRLLYHAQQVTVGALVIGSQSKSLCSRHVDCPHWHLDQQSDIGFRNIT